MASLTAEVLIGESNPYHGGIYPTHHIYLSENSKPGLIFVQQNYMPEEKASDERKVWIPTIEKMLEDVLLMVNILVLEDAQIIELFNKFINKDKKDYKRIEMYEDFSEEHREKLYHACRMAEAKYKLVFNIFKGSSLYHQVERIKDYNMEVEICMPEYVRWHHAMDEEIKVVDNLKIDDYQ